jgi:hypothetical protein
MPNTRIQSGGRVLLSFLLTLLAGLIIVSATEKFANSWPNLGVVAPEQSERAVRVHVMFTMVMFALATASRLQYARETTGGEPVGWQRWRRQLCKQSRDKVIVFAEGHYGIFHLAEYSLLLGVKLNDIAPDIGSRQQVWTKYRLPAWG